LASLVKDLINLLNLHLPSSKFRTIPLAILGFCLTDAKFALAKLAFKMPFHSFYLVNIPLLKQFALGL
jgi:hypothetical protein